MAPSFIAPIDQETLTEINGTIRRASFFINKLRMLGLISYNGHL